MKINLLNCWKYSDRDNWFVNVIRFGRIGSGFVLIFFNFGILISRK